MDGRDTGFPKFGYPGVGSSDRVAVGNDLELRNPSRREVGLDFVGDRLADEVSNGTLTQLYGLVVLGSSDELVVVRNDEVQRVHAVVPGQLSGDRVRSTFDVDGACHGSAVSWVAFERRAEHDVVGTGAFVEHDGTAAAYHLGDEA